MGPPPHELLTVTSTMPKAPKWSFNSRPATAHKMAGSGPNACHDPHRDTHGRFKRDPAWSMGSQRRGGRPLSASSDQPGPGRYAPCTDTLRQTAPSWGFGSTSRGGERWLFDGAVGPGPAAYAPNFAAARRSTPSYSTGARSSNRSGSCGPGPAHYRPPRTTLDGKVGRWGTSRPQRPHSAPCTRRDTGPGPSYCPASTCSSEGPRYSLGVHREVPDHAPRKLCGPRTQFGY
eukprot:TRINITY_DN6920_c0_g1_i1.p1 TRINITY_DN6920_c0_g1~~TRINITY_DN6920_c0_g1_i1.p1  ORF type:complete len:257 (-),score=3.14 TRINITY_DN6920_c0_g1_i1:69-764(-)